MKLRRAVAIAAVTAVIGPVALLSAPAALATTEPSNTTSATPTESVSPSEVPGQSPSESESESAHPSSPSSTSPSSSSSSPGAGDSSSPSTTPSDGDSTSPAPSDSVSSSASGSADPEESDEPEESSSAPAPGESESPAPSEDPDELMPCDYVDEEYVADTLESEISGLPGRIVAGSGWHEFSLTTTNTSDVTLNEVAIYAEVENFEIEEDRALSPFLSLQYFNETTERWAEIRDSYEIDSDTTVDWAGAYFTGVETMKPDDYVTNKLRLAIKEDAPVGDGYAFGSGGYLDTVNGERCIAENYGTDAYFSVLKPGSSNEDPGEAKPGTGSGTDKPKPGPGPGSGKGGGTTPQGGVSQQPVTGNLAATGSSSAMPVIGLVGGLAVLAGAGAVFYVRKRKASDTPA
ncbi:LAETG motif-containing sortase-dependent surface protein [Streptomyces sp. NPDC059578]|uniref:LAETG motif-containing sortase-dependent surface protein n=1 Tax=Streptomyces sp. NPDC059578 TaxID=3346874 RepID=UPI0036B4A2D0